MRHRKSGRKLNVNPTHRRALMRNMVVSLIQHERIETTDAKAKELRGLADRMITLGKRGDLHARRQAFAAMRNKEATTKLFEEIAGRYTDRNGGYTRVIKLGRRVGDNAPMAIIELVERAAEGKAQKAKGKKDLKSKIKETVKGGAAESGKKKGG